MLLVDLGMPGMDGGEPAERVLDLASSLVVVLMVAPDDAEARELLSGHHDLPRPWKLFALQELARKFHDLVGRRRRSPGYPLPAPRLSSPPAN